MSYRVQRVIAGKSIKETARFMGVSTVAVWQWETGKYVPKIDKLVKLAKFYGCSIDDLLAETSPRIDEAHELDVNAERRTQNEKAIR